MNFKPEENIYRNRLTLLIVLSISFFLQSVVAQTSNPTLKNDFKNPPENTKPWVYWYWINNHVSKEGITKDLESMASLGIGAALIGNIFLQEIDEEGQVPMLSETWEQLTLHAIREGQRLGVDIGLFNSPGWSQSGGPWNTFSNSMRYITSRTFSVTGGKTITQQLEPASATFEPIFTVAYPAEKESKITEATFTVTSSPSMQPVSLKSGLNLTEKKEMDLFFTAEENVTARSITITPAIGSTLMMEVTILSLEEGEWQQIRTFSFDRQNDMDQLGFNDAPPVVISFPSVTAKQFKIELRNIRAGTHPPVVIDAIRFSSAPKLDYFIEKQLGKMHQTPLPLQDAYRWPKQEEPDDNTYILESNSFLNLTNKIDEKGILQWDSPAGKWTIAQFGMAPTGIKNAPAAPNASGFEVDKINQKALRQHFEGFIGKILKALPKEERNFLKYIVADSYETGSQNWTDGFAEAFKSTYGYDPKTYLPVFQGAIVNSVDQSNRFLWDIRRFIADKVATDYVGGLASLCKEYDLQLWLENYGHWGFPSEFLKYGGQSHLIGGEFWAEGDLGSIECRAASSAAHIYGKNQVSAESYTAAGRPFLRYPATLKKRGDWSFTEGINHVVLHVYMHQPYDKEPGITTWFGTEFNRNNTWFPHAKSWIDYQRRNQVLLQTGIYVADVAYYIGEDAPKMTGVTQPPLPKGYSFDYINAEVLLKDATVNDGRITLPNGISYSLLVLPEENTMRPEVLKKIERLVSQGATIVGAPPTHSPSLKSFVQADKEVKAIAKKLWGNHDSPFHTYGKGRVYPFQDLETIFQSLEIVPDFKTRKEQPLLFIHRRTPDKEIYFITNQSDEKVTFTASFRVTGKRPQFWDPVTGLIRDLPNFSENGTLTSIPLQFEPSQSGYVVFDSLKEDALTPQEKNNYKEPTLIKTLTSPWTVHFKSEVLKIDKTITMNSLNDWTEYDDPDIKYFSGTATYRNTFTLDSTPSQNIMLRIGKANVLAEVTINGVKAGGLWTTPWQLDITKFLEKGQNQIEISVSNLWANQLMADGKRAESEKKTWTLTPIDYETNALQPSGLEGPVQIFKSHYTYQ